MASSSEGKHPLTTLNINWFAVPVNLADRNVCGGVNRKFETKLKLSSRGLTDEGFVVEVSSVKESLKEWFQFGDTMFKASCEELAGGVLHAIHKMLDGRLEVASVEVNNSSGSVTLQWENGEIVPSFPRKANEDEIKETEERRAQGPRNEFPC